MSETTVYRNALDLNSTLNEYRLESVLGTGGFGITYLARDNHLEKQVAIKEYLPGDLAVRALDGSVVPVSTDHQHDYQWGLDRFIQEARTLARFSHPHIVRVNRYFEANGTGYMVMDYEEGESLGQKLKRAPQPPEAELRLILLPLLDGLAAVHAAQFLHRDIKPSNIFVRANGSPVLLDFGAARANIGSSHGMTAVLTPGFAPLEQYAADGRQGPWTDLYALAAVLFRVVTDRNPPDAVSRLQADTVAQALAEARGRYSEPLLRAIEWGLKLQPELRPQSVADWREVFAAQAQLMPGATAPSASGIPATVSATAPAAAVTRKPPRPRRSEPGAGWRHLGMGLLLALSLLVGIDWHRRNSLPPPQPVPAKAPASTAAESVPATEIAPRAVDQLPSREFAAEADPRERPSRPELVPDRVRGDFRAADRDGDGYLSPAEVEGRFPVIAREFSRVDRDGDRRISAEEFAELRRKQQEVRHPVPSR
jgi:serine/threonine protein kinase